MKRFTFKFVRNYAGCDHGEVWAVAESEAEARELIEDGRAEDEHVNGDSYEGDLSKLGMNIGKLVDVEDMDPKPTPQEVMIGCLPELLEAGQHVVDSWESGDLAGAVNRLEGIIQAAKGEA